MTEIERKIDLRGRYSPEGRDSFIVSEPEDLIKNGIRASEPGVIATWGEKGLLKYKEAIKQKEAEVQNKL